MITINSDKGLIDVHSWDDILIRPTFKVGLDPDKHELKSIIGRYVFRDQVPCGLSSCRKPHNKGYVVTTKDSLETNIGKDCGSKYFGIDFDLQAKQFEKDLAAKENREMLWNFYFRTEELEAKILSLRESVKGANWVSRHCNALLNPPSVPVVVFRKLNDLAKQKTTLLTISREVTSEEFERMSVASGQTLKWPQYVDEPIAEIQGIEALYQENNLRELLVNGIEENLKSFKIQQIDLLNDEKLKFWKKWAMSVDLILEKAELAVAKGRILLTKANLQPLFSLPGMEVKSQKSLFESFIEKLQT